MSRQVKNSIQLQQAEKEKQRWKYQHEGKEVTEFLLESYFLPCNYQSETQSTGARRAHLNLNYKLEIHIRSIFLFKYETFLCLTAH